MSERSPLRRLPLDDHRASESARRLSGRGCGRSLWTTIGGVNPPSFERSPLRRLPLDDHQASESPDGPG